MTSIFDKLSPSARMQARVELAKKKGKDKGQRPLSSLPDPVDWIEANFYIPETGEPMKLYPSQAIPLREALRVGEDGLFVYSTVCWSAIKKSAKSSIAAAVGLWWAFNNPWSSIKVVANDLKQAASRSYEYMTRAIKLHPEWSQTCKVNKYTIELPNNSRVEAIPQDPEGEAGGGDDFVLYTEVWGWKHARAEKMWTESTLSPLKYGRSMRWAESYAGRVGESPILESLHEQGVKEGKLINEEYEYYRNGRMFCLWQTRPHLPWQTVEYYDQERALLSPEEFDRVHSNKWAMSTMKFVPDVWWENCYRNYERTTEIVVALDAAVSGDCFAMVGVSRHIVYDDDYQIVEDITRVEFVRVWEPEGEGKIRYTNPHDVNDRSTPEGEIRWLCDNWLITQVAYDEYQLHSLCNRLNEERISDFVVFPQGKQRAVADKQLYDDIRGGRIWHKGDGELTEHVHNADRKEEGDNKLRLVKRKGSLKIDACVALSMANYAIRNM